LGSLGDDEDGNRAWENIRENIKTSPKESLGLHELKRNKPWVDEECIHFLDERKQAKLQWVQVRREANKHFRNKKKAYLKAKIEDLEINSKI
jgi:hypothetical protein